MIQRECPDTDKNYGNVISDEFVRAVLQQFDDKLWTTAFMKTPPL